MKKLTADEFAAKVMSTGTELEVDELRTQSLRKYNRECSEEEIQNDEQAVVLDIYAHINVHDGDVKTEDLSGDEDVYKRQVHYGIDDYIYAQSGVLIEDEKYHSYHHLKIIYAPSGRAYVKCFGKRIDVYKRQSFNGLLDLKLWSVSDIDSI